MCGEKWGSTKQPTGSAGPHGDSQTQLAILLRTIGLDMSAANVCLARAGGVYSFFINVAAPCSTVGPWSARLAGWTPALAASLLSPHLLSCCLPSPPLLSSSPGHHLASLCPRPAERAPGRSGAGPRRGEPVGLDSLHCPQASLVTLEAKKGLHMPGPLLPAGKCVAHMATSPLLFPPLGFCTCWSFSLEVSSPPLCMDPSHFSGLSSHVTSSEKP